MRLFLEPEPENSAHPGYRGPLKLTDHGVEVSTECEYLFVRAPFTFSSEGRLPDSEWVPVEMPCLVPWHRVNLIELDSES